jgi:DNA-binding GntR family transcriptional regulator
MRPIASSAHQSSPDLVVDAIKQGILRGRLVPGQRLIEADLTRELRVSRGPVREALKRLAAEGIVALSPHRGAYIRSLGRGEIDDLLDVVESVVGFAIRRAAERIDEGDSRAKLMTAYQQLSQHGPFGDRSDVAVDRAAFYDTIFEIARNRELSRVNPVIPTQILRLQVHAYLTREEHTQQFGDYGVMVEAILAGDSRRARKIFEQHIRRSREQTRHIPDNALPADANSAEGESGAAANGGNRAASVTSPPEPRYRRAAGQRPSR